MTGFLTTHVLDTASGRPASGMRLELFRIDEGGGRTPLGHAITNADGRTEEPLLEQEGFGIGKFEIVFDVGAYFGEGGAPPFLDDVPIRFGISDPTSHYHVPLLVSPFSYSTYRGS